MIKIDEEAIKSCKDLASKIFAEGWASIKNPVLLCIARTAYLPYQNIYACPASRKFHHNFELGYIMHIAELLDLALSFKKSGQTPFGREMDWDVILTAIFLHDIGKLEAYEKTDDGYKYSKTAELIDHLSDSHVTFCILAAKFELDKGIREKVEHCILSHHGRQEWGSPIEPKTPEAWFLHLVDMISSRCTNFKEKEE
jgi:3'-5' exoribonuclease